MWGSNNSSITFPAKVPVHDDRLVILAQQGRLDADSAAQTFPNVRHGSLDDVKRLAGSLLPEIPLQVPHVEDRIFGGASRLHGNVVARRLSAGVPVDKVECASCEKEDAGRGYED
jgi:hypothetical protein